MTPAPPPRRLLLGISTSLPGLLLLYLLLLLLPSPQHGLSQHQRRPRRTLRFPLLHEEDGSATDEAVKRAFQTMVASSEFFQPLGAGKSSECAIPLFGSDAMVSFARGHDGDDDNAHSSSSFSSSAHYLLTVEGCSVEDFGWVCTKFHEEKGRFPPALDHGPLRRAVARHFNSLPPHPGYDAHAPWSSDDADPDRTPQEEEAAHAATASAVASLFPEEVMRELTEEGFAVIDDACKTSPSAVHRLAEHLDRPGAASKTGQSADIRTDRVAFVGRKEARTCGLQNEYDMLMAIATFMNDREALPWRDDSNRGDGAEGGSGYDPILPGTASRPLTVPRHIQVAEYGHNEFYTRHSDNGISRVAVSAGGTSDRDGSSGGAGGTGETLQLRRRNYRYLTCIYYLNEDWSEEDGGALRIFKNSGDCETMDEVIKEGCESCDVLPFAGRLLVFDSRLAHEVRRNLNADGKIRRALTLWITRPEQSGARGEVWDEGA